MADHQANIGLLLMVMFGATSAAEPVVEGIAIEGGGQRASNPDLHPEIRSVDFEYRYDYEYREYEAIVTVGVVLYGKRGRSVLGTAVFRSYYDHTDWEAEAIKRGRWNKDQWRAFKMYTQRVLSCQDGHEQAHVYDDTLTHNPNSPLSIYDYANELWGIRQAWQCDGNNQTPPPPIGVEPTVCVPEAAPYVDEIADVTTEHFDLYVYPDIGDGVGQAYDFDGVGWALTEENGRFEHETCAEQEDCETEPIYTAAEQEVIVWYVALVEQYCQEWLEQGGYGIVIEGTTQLASLETTPIEFDPIQIAQGHQCKEQIANVMLFLKLSLLRGAVWNAAFYNLQLPYDYSAAQVAASLKGIEMGLTPAKLMPIRSYLLLWNGTGNLDNRLLWLIYGDLRPFVQALADDLG